MFTQPRIRVSAVLRWRDGLLLCRHEKHGKEYWLLPGGGLHSGESLLQALRSELREELGISDDLPFEGPVALVDSIAPPNTRATKHVVHIIFAADLTGRSLETVSSEDAAVRGHRLFTFDELDEVVLHPPIQRFLGAVAAGGPGGLPRRALDPLTIPRSIERVEPPVAGVDELLAPHGTPPSRTREPIRCSRRPDLRRTRVVSGLSKTTSATNRRRISVPSP